MADLDGAIGRAVRDTWPGAIVVASRHHVAAQIREQARADGIPERIRLEVPIATRRALPWTGERVRRFAPHPLHEAALGALRGPAEWAALLALVERHVPPDRLALRGWIATNELLVRRGWLIRDRLRDVPLSTGALEGAIGEWLAPLRRRAGRWQNARRLDLVLGLLTLRARGDAREARYARIVRAAFATADNRSHVASSDDPAISWWRTFHDRDEPSLPRLVREATRRWRAGPVRPPRPGHGAPRRAVCCRGRPAHPVRPAGAAIGPAEAADSARGHLGPRPDARRVSRPAARVGVGRQR